MNYTFSTVLTCLLIITSLHTAYAVNTRDATVIVRQCPAKSLSVVITTPVYDDVGPGFGANKIGARPLLGRAAREACLDPETATIVAWQSNKGYDFIYHDEVEVTFEILQAKYGKLRDEYDTFTEGLTLPHGGEAPTGYEIEIYYFAR